jgi:hypothetical protein
MFGPGVIRRASECPQSGSRAPQVRIAGKVWSHLTRDVDVKAVDVLRRGYPASVRFPLKWLVCTAGPYRR